MNSFDKVTHHMRRYTKRNPKNKTAYAALDDLAADPRITEIRDEGRDGFWADLADGFNAEGCSSIHGEIENYGSGNSRTAVAALLGQVYLIEEGDPY